MRRTIAPVRLAGLLPVLCAGLLGLNGATPAHADTPLAYVFPEAELRFGRIAVFGSGTRIVTPAGGVTDSSGIMPAAGDLPGPARFSVGYDKGNNGNNAINVTFQIAFGSIPPFSQAGVTATVTGMTSDLPGGATLVPGQILTISIRGCRTRQCGVSFSMGGQLNVTQSGAGAEISTPIPVSVTVTSVN